MSYLDRSKIVVVHGHELTAMLRVANPQLLPEGAELVGIWVDATDTSVQLRYAAEQWPECWQGARLPRIGISGYEVELER